MKKKSINFSSRLVVAKKISIKDLDFEKLPRKFSGINYGLSIILFNFTKISFIIVTEGFFIIALFS